MYKPIPKEIREEILVKVKQGKHNVPELANQYGLSSKTIYAWLRKETVGEINIVEHNWVQVKSFEDLALCMIMDQLSNYNGGCTSFTQDIEWYNRP